MFRRVLQAVLLSAVVVWGADPVVLYQEGKQAYDRLDCLTALPSLYAFLQAAPPGMINPPLAQALNKAVDFCRGRLEADLRKIPQLQAEIDRLRGSGIGSTTQGLSVAPPPLPPTVAQNTGPTYPLRCRGGSLAATILAGEVRIHFQTAGAADDPTHLQPGYCGWLDRPMADTEPRQICHRTTSGRTAVTVQQGRVQAGAPWAYLGRLDDSGAVFEFQVANDGQGCMVTGGEPRLVVRVRPDAIRPEIINPKTNRPRP